MGWELEEGQESVGCEKRTSNLYHTKPEQNEVSTPLTLLLLFLHAVVYT
jgi:hypothetical protein